MFTPQPGRSYSIITVARTADCEALGTAASLRELGGVDRSCAHCRRPVLLVDTATLTRCRHTPLICCLQCSPEVAAALELPDHVRATYRELARALGIALAAHRRREDDPAPPVPVR